jgi:hypothetical protein
VLGKVVYWLAVLVISLAIVVVLVYVLESQDQSSVGGPSAFVAASP